MEEKEIWKPIGIFKGVGFCFYEVSTFGNVRSIDRTAKGRNGAVQKLKGKILHQYKNKDGYMQLNLSYDGKRYLVRVHQLVMNVFNPNPNPEIYTDINHIDEDKTNNRLDNLEWVTHKENMNHGTAIKRQAQRLRENFIPIIQLDFDGNIINVYYKVDDFNNTEFIENAVVEAIREERCVHKGYFWIRLDDYNNLSQNELISLIDIKVYEMNIRVLKPFYINNRIVIQLSKNGDYMKEYPSITVAAKKKWDVQNRPFTGVYLTSQKLAKDIDGGIKSK